MRKVSGMTKLANNDSTNVDNDSSTINLEQFIAQMRSHQTQLALPEIQKLLSSLRLSESELRPFRHFSKQAYQRNLIARSETFELLLLCFEAGQRTPIHDHAGSACGVKVIEGTATETMFDKSVDNWLFATGSHELAQSGVVGSTDMDIHQLSNLQPDNRRLVTLHVYISSSWLNRFH